MRRELDHVLRLLAEEPDGLDMLDQPVFAKREHLFGAVGHREEPARRLVDAGIGRLRRQRHCDHQRVGVDVVQLALGLRFALVEPAEHFADRVVIHLSGHEARYRAFLGRLQAARGAFSPCYPLCTHWRSGHGMARCGVGDCFPKRHGILCDAGD